MQQQEIKFFEGKNIKLVLRGDYALYGTIEKVAETSIFFRTPTKTSLIDISEILRIVEW